MLPDDSEETELTLSGKLRALACFVRPSFLDRGVPSPARRKPTRFAADFIMPSGLIGLAGSEAGVGILASVFAAMVCFEEDNVGVMKCGDLDLRKFSLPMLGDDSIV